jgi:hypothetical protein
MKKLRVTNHIKTLKARGSMEASTKVKKSLSKKAKLDLRTPKISTLKTNKNNQEMMMTNYDFW